MRRPVKPRYFGELKTTKRPQTRMCPHRKRPRTLLPQESMQIFCSFSYVAFFRFGIFPSGEFGGSQRKKARPAHRRKKMRGKRQSQPSPLPSLRGNQREIFKHVFWLMPALRIFRTQPGRLPANFAVAYIRVSGQLQRRDRVRFSRTSVCLKTSQPT